MSSLSSSTSPVWRVPSMRSFMRLSARRNVDLPQPDGPIRATTERSGMSSEMSWRACLAPYQKDRLRTANFDTAPGLVEGSRPTMLRSEMMAEYDRVDMQAPQGAHAPRTHSGKLVGTGILRTDYVFLMKNKGRLG